MYQFWILLVGEIILWLVLVNYFSKGFRNLLNIHAVTITFIILYPFPSTILILNGEIPISENKLLVLFSSIYLGLIGYALGTFFFKKIFVSYFKKKRRIKLYKKLNALFWLTYKYRYVLAFIICIVIAVWGFSPRGMSYRESVVYRMKTTGVISYFKLLIPTVFSPLIVAMISIIGDIKKNRKISWLSFILIILVIFSIIGGHRIWIIAIFVCFILAFQSRLKRKHVLFLVISAAIITFVISGAVRYARGGESFSENIKKFYEYFVNGKKTTLTKLMWGFDSLSLPFSTYLTLINNVPQNINFDYLAYVKDASLLIPEIVYPNRPLPYNEWFVKTFEPDLYEKGGGKTFYVLGFGYLFSGLIGVFIHLLLFGILFEWLNIFFESIGGAVGLFLYSYFFIQLLRFAVGCGLIVFIKTSILLNFFIPILLLFSFVFSLNTLITGKFKY